MYGILFIISATLCAVPGALFDICIYYGNRNCAMVSLCAFIAMFFASLYTILMFVNNLIGYTL